MIMRTLYKNLLLLLFIDDTNEYHVKECLSEKIFDNETVRLSKENTSCIEKIIFDFLLKLFKISRKVSN